MAIALSTRSRVGFIAEVTNGTTPATPAFAELPSTNWNVNLTRDAYEDTSIRADRMSRYNLSGNNEVAGSFDVNFTHGYYDAFLESLCQGAWTTNVLKTGNTRKTFAIEEQQLDIVQYRVFNGVLVDKFTLKVPAKGVVTGTFEVLALSQSALSGTTFTGATFTAAAIKNPFTDYGASGFMKEGGSAVGYISGLDLSFDNGYTKNFAIASNVVREFSTNRLKITGTATVFFEDAVMYNKFVNGTASSLDLKLDNGTNTLQILLPNIKYTAATKTITNGSGGIEIQMPFEALYDGTSLSNVVFTRN
jgi:hypothetical protein